jgi:hypothetical protein
MEETRELDVEVITKTRTKVAVSFPLYRRHDLMLDDADSIIYRRVDKDLSEVSVQIANCYSNGVERYELEFDKTQIDGSDYSLGKAQYASNRDEFFGALQKLSDAVEKVKGLNQGHGHTAG